MFVEYCKGDLLKDNSDALVNAVNRLGFMGAGIALAFREKFPEMFTSYQQLCKEGAYKTSFVTFYTYPKDKNNGICIANLQTVDDNLRGDYSLVEAGLKQLRETAENTGIQSIAIPPLGCGIGLNKKKVEEMILSTFKDMKITLRLYNF